jgi:hypothetical protein
MRFREQAVEQITAHLQQLGLARCPVCSGETLGVDRRPVWMYVGGVPEAKDSTTNIVYLLRVLCQVCGHVMLFDSEQYAKGDDPIFETP